jgi:glycosyltransferase involved in cell wall biosynthesis
MRPAINLLPWRLGYLPRRPAVAVTAHDLLLPYLFPKAGRLRAWVTRRLLADADMAIVTNEADLAQVARDWGLGSRSQSLAPLPRSPALIPIGNNIVAPPPAGYERASWRAQLGIAPGEVLVAYFGLLSRSKGLDVLIDALARLPAHYRLLVIGGAANAPTDRAYAESIQQQLEQLGHRASITGHCAEAEVAAHLLAADVAALPFADGASFRRGSLLAALAHGLPVVTTLPPSDDRRLRLAAEGLGHAANDSEAASQLVVGGRLVDGENALLVPAGDAQALAGAIDRLARDTPLRERLAIGGRSLAAQFGWPEIAARHEELYARMIQQRRATQPG